MKKSVIVDIFNGFRGQHDTMHMGRDSEEYLKSLRRVEDELKEKLSAEMLKLHNEHISLLENRWSEEIGFYYSEGLKLGILVGIECMEN